MIGLAKTLFVLLPLALFSIGVHAHNNVVVIPMGDDNTAQKILDSRLSSCKEIQDAALSNGDGPYMIISDSVGTIGVYCDMSTGTTYEAFAFGNHGISYPGYTIPDITQWQNIALQQAFIWHHNANKGLRNIDAGFTSNNCCIYLENQNTLIFGGEQLRPYSLDGTKLCSNNYHDDRYYIGENRSGLSLPMPSDFFTTKVVTQSVACGLNNNPGIFVKRYQ